MFSVKYSAASLSEFCAWTYEYAQGRMSMHVYCVLVVRAWTYEYGLNQMEAQVS